FSRLILSLYRHNGSITKTASERFIHKNTVQYKLNRIAEMTGYNPRDWLNIPLFYLAILFRERNS
ncbi:MAG TPA: helix-turn-helix domain-containing protein, partial [Candidatus Ventricola intestinavium]|nr:helix-turn-helix domain-containing protein [Candidatus Ventricola intestinavium]